ncbi:MAG: HAMP domain-containing sensor histidine kinase [bacterium]
MSFQTRLLVTFLLAVLLPMIGLALFIRSEMTQRITTQYERRVESLIEVIGEDLSQESDAIASSLRVLRASIVEDGRLRNAIVNRTPEERRYLLDFAGHAMQLARLSMLQIQDDSGRIISSGHFRNEYDRLEPELPRLLAATPEGTALVPARTPDAHFLALAHVDSFTMADRTFTVVAGIKIDRRFLTRLTRDADLTVKLVYPGGEMTSGRGAHVATPHPPPGALNPGGTDSVTARASAPPDKPAGAGEIGAVFTFPYADLEKHTLTDARFRVTHRLDDLWALRGDIDRWCLVALAAAALLAAALVGWIASRISRPLVELADKTSRVDLDRLDIDFDTRRRDELGVLSRVLGEMTDRLRESAAVIRDAERRATLGELARQVNHDIKNGLTPIRNVFRHLTELAATDPDRLPPVFKERQGTLDSSMSYLESLASNYARLSLRGQRRPCRVNEIVRRIAADLRRPETGAVIDTDLSDDDPVVTGDPVALRRILENLVDNAVDSLESRPGRVTIATSTGADESGQPRVEISVTDTGTGLDDGQRAKIFDDFYTTKETGTGLGLSIVRRLVLDLDGTIRVESKRNEGSRFIIDLPREIERRA